MANEALFIGATGESTATSVTWPAGTAEGDIALIFSVGTGSLTGSGLTHMTSTPISGSSARTSWKVLTAGDVSSFTVTVPTYGFYMILVFRGPTTATLKSNAASTGASASVSGFTKAAGSQFIVSAGFDRDPSTLDYVTSWEQGAQGQGSYFGMTTSWLASADYDETGWTQDLTASSYQGCYNAIELT